MSTELKSSFIKVSPDTAGTSAMLTLTLIEVMPVEQQTMFKPQELDFLKQYASGLQTSPKQDGFIGILAKRALTAFDMTPDDFYKERDTLTCVPVPKLIDYEVKLDLLWALSTDRDLSVGKRALLGGLLRITDDRTDSITGRSIDDIAAAARLSKSATCDNLNALEKEGWFTRPTNNGGRQKRTEYHGVFAGILAWFKKLVTKLKTVRSAPDSKPEETVLDSRTGNIPKEESSSTERKSKESTPRREPGVFSEDLPEGDWDDFEDYYINSETDENGYTIRLAPFCRRYQIGDVEMCEEVGSFVHRAKRDGSVYPGFEQALFRFGKWLERSSHRPRRFRRWWNKK